MSEGKDTFRYIPEEEGILSRGLINSLGAPDEYSIPRHLRRRSGVADREGGFISVKPEKDGIQADATLKRIQKENDPFRFSETTAAPAESVKNDTNREPRDRGIEVELPSVPDTADLEAKIKNLKTLSENLADALKQQEEQLKLKKRAVDGEKEVIKQEHKRVEEEKERLKQEHLEQEERAKREKWALDIEKEVIKQERESVQEEKEHIQQEREQFKVEREKKAAEEESSKFKDLTDARKRQEEQIERPEALKAPIEPRREEFVTPKKEEYIDEEEPDLFSSRMRRAQEKAQEILKKSQLHADRVVKAAEDLTNFIEKVANKRAERILKRGAKRALRIVERAKVSRVEKARAFLNGLGRLLGLPFIAVLKGIFDKEDTWSRAELAAVSGAFALIFTWPDVVGFFSYILPIIFF